MPTPVGHSLMGYIIYQVAPRSVRQDSWRSIALYLFAANVPDLDFVPGFFIGDPNRYHHGVSHTIGFCLVFAFIFSLFIVMQKKSLFWQHFIVFFCLCCSHIILDYMSIDDGFPYGVPLFWPLSKAYFIAPFAFFPDIWRASSSKAFIPSLFSLHNLWAVTVEALLLLPCIILISDWKQRVGTLPQK